MRKLVPVAIIIAFVVSIFVFLPRESRVERGKQAGSAEPPGKEPGGDRFVPVDVSQQKVKAAQQKTDERVSAVSTAKPFDDHVAKGIAYLVGQQQKDGGWGQGGGWRQSATKGGRVEGKNVADPSDVGSTALALIVLLRAGNSLQSGEYAANVGRGLEYLYRHVEAADEKSLYVTEIRDTQLQVKIGPYVDTFLATWALSEFKGHLPAGTSDSRLLAALDKMVGKIEGHQKDDGTFEGNRAWASVHSQGLNGYALNSAAQNGVKLKPETLRRDFKLAMNGLDVAQKKFSAAAPAGSFSAGGMSFSGGRSSIGSSAPSNAGIDLYQQSTQSLQLSANIRSNAKEFAAAEATIAAPTAPPVAKRLAREQLAYRATQSEAIDAANTALAGKLDDKRFIGGFGNNGGEEFLSYMNISLSLRSKGGADWEKWDRQVTENLDRVQNGDGSWSGDHCITGRTFCTSTALLTLMAERAPLTKSLAASDSAK